MKKRRRNRTPADTTCPKCRSPETVLMDEETGMWACTRCEDTFPAVDNNACVACGGSGISSKNGICVPCDGWGYRDLADAVRRVGGRSRPVPIKRTAAPTSLVPVLGTIMLDKDDEHVT